MKTGMGTEMGTGMRTEMKRELRPIRRMDPEKVFVPSEDTVVYWLSGVSFLLHSRNTNILIDPVLMKDPEDPECCELGFPFKIEDLPLTAEDIPADTHVLFTHEDRDHMGPESVRILADKGCPMTGTYRTFEALARLGVPVSNLHVLRDYETEQMGEVIVEATPADHPWQLKNIREKGRPYRAGECCGFFLRTPDGSVWFPGDTRLMEEHLRLEEPDLLILDVSTDEYHLGHGNAVVLANRYRHSHILPFHYGTYDMPHVPAQVGEPEDVYPMITDSGKRCHKLMAGESYILRRVPKETE